MSTLAVLGLHHSGLKRECERARLRACHPDGLPVSDVSVGNASSPLATFKIAAMSVKADGPAAEEEENSGLYYSDEDDDLGAFSDAEIGCEDGGRTSVEGHTHTHRDKDARLRGAETPFMAAKIVCGDACAGSGGGNYREVSLRPDFDGRSFGFTVKTNTSNVWRAE